MSVRGLPEWEVVIGLEVHVQLLTDSKLFSPAPNDPREAPNQNVDVVDVALPGTLPVMNARVPEMAARLGLALDATVRQRSVFARKHYVYPDLPKGYQISQFDEPVVEHGTLVFDVEAGEKQREMRVHIVRAHIEEDAGKSLHIEGSAGDDSTYLDYNRAGTPLLEVVTAPDMRTPDEAMECFRALRTLVMTLGICDGNLQEGSMRADANVSVRKVGDTALGTRTETKNLNSPRYLAAAVEHEARRQIAELLAGKKIVQETRLWDPDRKETRSMRTKEDAHDYRYFTDPDLPPVVITDDALARVKRELPELPRARRARYVSELALTSYDATLIADEPALVALFEATLSALATSGGDAARVKLAKACANWLLNDVSAAVNARGLPLERVGEIVTPTALASLVSLVDAGAISGKTAKDVLAEIVAGRGADPVAIVDAKGWRVVKDAGALEKIVDDVLAANPQQVEKVKAGKTQVLGFLVGQVMKQGKGAFDPKDVNEMLANKLKGAG